MKIKGRICDFCGAQIHEKYLFLGSKFLYDLQIKTAGGSRIDMCHECAGFFKDYCKERRIKIIEEVANDERKRISGNKK